MITEMPFEQRWVLQGRLCGEWAVDLRKRWEEALNARPWRRYVIDLEDVTSVDRIGESVLLQMLTQGAQAVARRAYMKDVIANVKRQQS